MVLLREVAIRTLARVCMLVLLALPFAIEAQPAKQLWRIGFLGSSSAERDKTRLAAFRQGLRERGYVEGRNIAIEERYAAGRAENLPRLARELLESKVDVLVTEGTPAARAAKEATSTTPVVMGNAGDPVGSGLVASLSRPGTNITGLSDSSFDVVAKRLELLKAVAPATSHVAVLLNPSNPSNPLEWRRLLSVAPAIGVTLQSFEIRQAADLERAYEVMRKRPGGAVILAGDALFGVHRERIVSLAAGTRVPTLYPARLFVDSGGLLSYGTNFDDLFRRAAAYVDRILKGANPADLPVEQPTKFELVINQKAARGLGLTVPQSLLVQADEVIQK